MSIHISTVGSVLLNLMFGSPPPQLVSLPEAKLLLKEDDELIREVFDYWSRKRKVCKAGCLLAIVKQEKRDGSSTGDPYVAFRRRTEKMQTRKVSTSLTTGKDHSYRLWWSLGGNKSITGSLKTFGMRAKLEVAGTSLTKCILGVS